MSMFLDDGGWTPPAEFPNLQGTVALDTETRDRMFTSHGSGWPFALKLQGQAAGYIIGVSLAWYEGSELKSGYWPVAHQPGGNVDPEPFKRWLRAQLARPDLNWVGAFTIYDMGWLRSWDCHPTGLVDDVLLMAPLLDENRTAYSLDAVGRDYAGIRKDESLLKQAAHAFGIRPQDLKSNMWRMPPQFVGPYAEQDAVAAMRTYEALQPLIEKEGLGRAYATERDLGPLLLDMRARGVRIDVQRAERMIVDFAAKEELAQTRIKRLHGKHLDPWANDEIGKALASRGVKLGATAGGKLSTAKGVLKGLNDDLAKAVMEVRRWNKARTVFAEGYILNHVVNGRLHCSFNQLRRDDDQGRTFGTITHRFSSSDPNLQNLPSPDNDKEIAVEVRGSFLPEEGEEWVSLDYSSQEPRWMIHYSAAAGVPGGAEEAAEFNANPRRDLYQPIANKLGQLRKKTKIMFLALAYGQKDGGLCALMGYPTEEASFRKWQGGKEIEIFYKKAGAEGKAALDQFDEAAPFVRKLRAKVEQATEDRGYVVSAVDGARFRSSVHEGRIMDLHKMLNKLIQGSAARQMKRAMVDIHKAGLGHRLLVTVHDENGATTDGPKTTARLRELMENAVPNMLVPTVLDVAVGPSWGACVEVMETEEVDEAEPEEVPVLT